MHRSVILELKYSLFRGSTSCTFFFENAGFDDIEVVEKHIDLGIFKGGRSNIALPISIALFQLQKSFSVKLNAFDLA